MLREPIAHSWSRAQWHGLNPGSTVIETVQLDVDPGGRLIRAAKPVIDEIASELGDENFSVILADHDSIIVNRWLGRSGLGTSLDQVFAAPGFRFQ